MYCPPQKPAVAPSTCRLRKAGMFCHGPCKTCDVAIAARVAANVRRSTIATARLMRATPAR